MFDDRKLSEVITEEVTNKISKGNIANVLKENSGKCGFFWESLFHRISKNAPVRLINSYRSEKKIEQSWEKKWPDNPIEKNEVHIDHDSIGSNFVILEQRSWEKFSTLKETDQGIKDQTNTLEVFIRVSGENQRGRKDFAVWRNIEPQVRPKRQCIMYVQFCGPSFFPTVEEKTFSNL